MVLPIFKPISMRSFLSQERYSTVERCLMTELENELAKSPFDAPSARRFLESYFGDLATNFVASQLKEVEDDRHSNTSEALLDSSLLLLQRLLAESSQPSNSSLLLDAILASGGIQDSALQDILISYMTADTALEILTPLYAITQGCFGTRMALQQTLDSLVQSTYVWAAVLQAGIPVMLEQFTSPNNQQWFNLLLQIYDVMLPSIANSPPGFDRDADWAPRWFKVKVSILDSLHAILGFLSAHTERLDRLCDFASQLAEKSCATPATALFDASLMQDYQKLFKLSEEMMNVGERMDNARLQALGSKLRIYGESAHVDRSIVKKVVPQKAIDSTSLVRTSQFPSEHKGKARATSSDDDSSIELSVSYILEILPDQDPSFLRRCLTHPTYRGEGGTERLLSHLLEGSVPIDLSVQPEETGRSQKIEEMELVKNRRNVFDDQAMDVTTLRLGKKRDNADDMMQDKTWLQEMKAEILRRAEANAEEEEEEARYYRSRGKRFIPVEEGEFDDDDEAGISVVGDGEASGSDNEAEPSGSVETILELAYIENPRLFDRDSATRRSTARANLKLRTGWGDEQIEGWRIMLERNPLKNKILQMHEFRGNQRGPVHPPQPAVREQQSLAGRNRGGNGNFRGKGRGRSGGQTQGQTEGSGGSDARDRARKERNKNQQRRRGHDRKMVRGGLGPPA